MTKAITPPRARPRGRRTAVLPEWSKPFLDHLAASSNVRAAARKAGISTATAYEARRGNPAFQRAWLQALCEGYDLLEMELLHRLRSGQTEYVDAEGNKRKFDLGTAFRCLFAHRDTVTREKGRRTLAEEAATIASVNARIDAMRAREAEARRLLADISRPQQAAGDGGDGE